MIGSGLFWAAPAQADCAAWNPVAQVGQYGGRAITSRDLIELVNFGRPDLEPLGGQSAFGVSPDGRWIAMVLQRADLPNNSFCQALVLIDRFDRAPPRVLDRGGGFMLATFAIDGHYDSNGISRLNVVRFSADGQSIGYLKRDDGRTRLWVAHPEGQQPAPLTPPTRDVSKWAWSGDGRSLVFAYDVGAEAAEASIESEGLGGWHFDGRMAPMLGLRPQMPAPLAEKTEAISIADGKPVVISAEDRTTLASDGELPLDRRRAGAPGWTAWAAALRDYIFAPSRIQVRNGGAAVECTAAACTGAMSGLWWSENGRTLNFLKHEGWNDRFTALYRWTPGRGQPARLLLTDDVIEGCTRTSGDLICVRQGAVQPPRLVAIDVASGRERVLFDPNPGFGELKLGHVERLEWRNNVGRAVYGDLVLPPGYRGGRLPTIVTLYRSHGFLRGGTGNDYPIQLFAKRGFAVLSIGRPALFAAGDPSVTNNDDFWRLNNRDWADRRSVDSAIQSGLDLLIAKGIADPARLALTGLSDGSSSVRFALINSRRFAAAAISSCCVDESADDAAGPGWTAQSAALGYPPAAPVDTQFWQPYSLALNARTMTTPLLMQLADTELLTSLHAYAALKAAGQPVDLYFYPNEYHFKWQPQHRQAVYDRNLDWFSFWLQDRTDSAAAKTAQFAHWRALRDAARSTRSP